jgi:hypothetical protein
MDVITESQVSRESSKHFHFIASRVGCELIMPVRHRGNVASNIYLAQDIEGVLDISIALSITSALNPDQWVQ